MFIVFRVKAVVCEVPRSFIGSLALQALRIDSDFCDDVEKLHED